MVIEVFLYIFFLCQRERERDSYQLPGSLFRCPLQRRIGQTKTRSQDLSTGLPYVWQGHNYWASLAASSVYISRQPKLEGESTWVQYLDMEYWHLHQYVTCLLVFPCLKKLDFEILSSIAGHYLIRILKHTEIIHCILSGWVFVCFGYPIQTHIWKIA